MIKNRECGSWPTVYYYIVYALCVCVWGSLLPSVVVRWIKKISTYISRLYWRTWSEIAIGKSFSFNEYYYYVCNVYFRYYDPVFILMDITMKRNSPGIILLQIFSDLTTRENFHLYAFWSFFLVFTRPYVWPSRLVLKIAYCYYHLLKVLRIFAYKFIFG